MPPTPNDPPLSELLEHQEFVRRLARHLVGDASRADDLVQDVWVAALRSRPTGISSMRAWLARVTRNKAAKTMRSDEHRKAREERVAESQAGRAPDEFEAEFELQRLVSEVVDKLDEPHRRTILLRYFKDMSHAEIASKTGVPLATVRTRLQRGLQLVREELDRKHNDERVLWERGLLALAGKDFLLPIGSAKVAGASAHTAPIATGSTLWTSGVLMGLLAKVGVAVAVVFGIAMFAMGPDWGSGEVSLAAVDDDAPSGLAAFKELAAVELPPTVGPDRESARELLQPVQHPNLTALEPGALASRLRILSDETGEPVPGALVELWSRPAVHLDMAAMVFVLGDFYTGFSRFGDARRYQSDADGYVMVPILPLATIVRASTDTEVGFLRLTGKLKQDGDLIIITPTSMVVRVEDTLGNRRPGARVWMGGFPGGGFVHTDERGEVLFQHTTSLLPLLAESFDLVSPRPNFTIGGYPGPTGEIVDAVLASAHATVVVKDAPAEVVLVTRPAGLVRVELVNAMGQPTTIGSPYVLFELEQGGISWSHRFNDFKAGPRLDNWLPWGAVFSATFIDGIDEDSMVRMEGVVPGPLASPLVWTIELEGLPEASVKGRLVDEAGDPLANFAVEIEQTIFPGVHIGPAVWMTDGDGVFSLPFYPRCAEGLAKPGSKYTLVFSDQSGNVPPRAKFTIERKDLTMEPIIDLGDIAFGPPDETPPVLVAAGQVVDANGDPLAGVSLIVFAMVPWELNPKVLRQERLESRMNWLSEEDGSFRIEGFEAPGDLFVVAMKAGWIQMASVPCKAGATGLAVPMLPSGSIAGSFELEVHTKAPECLIELSPSNSNGTSLPMGGARSRPGVFQMSDLPARKWTSLHAPDEDGQWSFKDLAEGFYDIRIMQGNFQAGNELLRIEGLHVIPGKPTTDERLTNLRRSSLVPR
jgi:RNA polymerase sigma factor (sigma-70 family)